MEMKNVLLHKRKLKHVECEHDIFVIAKLVKLITFWYSKLASVCALEESTKTIIWLVDFD